MSEDARDAYAVACSKAWNEVALMRGRFEDSCTGGCAGQQEAEAAYEAIESAFQRYYEAIESAFQRYYEAIESAFQRYLDACVRGGEDYCKACGRQTWNQGYTAALADRLRKEGKL